MSSVPRPSALMYQSIFHKNFNVDAPASTKTTTKEYEWVYVGGDNDDVFRALAAAFLDQVLSKRRIPKDTLQTLVQEHVNYFPEHGLKLADLKPHNRMDWFLLDSELPELLSAFAFTFRQIAVDEMIRNPSHYSQVFTSSTVYETLRRANTGLGREAIAAVAYRLNWPVEIQIVDSSKSLPERVLLNNKTQAPIAVIQFQGHHYMPRIYNVRRIKKAAAQPIEAVGKTPQKVDPNFTEIQTRIAAHHQTVYDSFSMHQKRLHNLVKLGELSQEQLLAVYCKSLRISNANASSRSPFSPQQRFAMIKPNKAPIDWEPPQSGSFTHELIDAVSRLISLGDAREEDVYALMDETPKHQPHS